MKKKLKKIFWWSIFIIFVAPSLLGGLCELTSGIGCEKFGSGNIGASGDNDLIKSLGVESSLWTKINPVEGWDIPPEWLEEWLEAQKNK